MVAPVPAKSRTPSRLPAQPRHRSRLLTTHNPLPTSPRMLTPFLLITYIQTKYLHALTHSFAQRRAAIPFAPKSLRTLSIATGVYLESVPDDTLSRPQRRQLFCLHQLAASLRSLFTLFSVRFLCFQSFAASFPKIPGVWLSRTVLRDTRVGGAVSFLRDMLRETFPSPPSYLNASTCREHTASLASSKARSGKERFRHERSSPPTR